MTGERQAGRITVVLADPCAPRRRLLRTVVELEHDLVVVAEASTSRQAVEMVGRLRPSVLLMGLDTDAAAGIEAIERIMSATPTPVLVSVSDPDLARRALAAGAADVLHRPSAEQGHAADPEGLRRTLRMCARVRVITHPRDRLRPVAQARAVRSPIRVIAIGASTGGPSAVHTVLSTLPVGCGTAVLVVQHMAEGFLPGLASYLDSRLPLPVVVGTAGERLRAGTVTFAPSGADFLVRDSCLVMVSEPPLPGQHHTPCIDRTLTSVARVLGPAAVGVLLTGMGRDGAAGLLAMREHGALTIAQDEATSAVYGMPAAAMTMHAVDRQLSLAQIARALREAVAIPTRQPGRAS